jgi:hypothetical protein
MAFHTFQYLTFAHMRYLVYSLLILTIATACKKDKRTEFFLIHDFIDFTIQPGLNTFDTHIYTVSPKFSTFHTQLEASSHTAEEVVAIEPRRAYLTSVFEDVNLDFIHQVSVRIYDPFDETNNIEFFYMDPVPIRSKTGIELFPGIANLEEWFDREYYGIEVRLNFRQNSPSLIQMRLEFDVRVLGE